MTREELNKIEVAEFEDAVRALAHERAFITLVVPWVYRARSALPQGPVNPEGLPSLNWAIGQAFQITELMREIERLDPPAHAHIMERVTAYARRIADLDAG